MNNIDHKYKKKSLPISLRNTGLTLLILGFLLGIVFYIINADRAVYNYLLTFVFLLSIGLGALFLVALEYIAGADWSTPIRRVPEFLSTLIPVLLIAALPLLFHISTIFEWAHEEVVASDHLLQKKTPYLNTTFFVIRVILFFLIWIMFYFYMLYNSRQQDRSGDQKLTKQNITASAIFMPVFAITLTLAAVDWIMSLQPHWFSTIFGVYIFSGAVVASLAAVTFATVKLREGGYLHPDMVDDHYYSLGALMFGFINFWAYIAFSQFLLIWYANLPETTFWFIQRWEGVWVFVSILLIITHFIVPYAVLLPVKTKKNPKVLKFISIWLLVAHLIDMYWLVMPAYHGESISPFLMILELAFPAAAVGGIILIIYYSSRKHNLVPVGDPKLKRGLNFRL